MKQPDSVILDILYIYVYWQWVSSFVIYETVSIYEKFVSTGYQLCVLVIKRANMPRLFHSLHAQHK